MPIVLFKKEILLFFFVFNISAYQIATKIELKKYTNIKVINEAFSAKENIQKCIFKKLIFTNKYNIIYHITSKMVDHAA